MTAPPARRRRRRPRRQGPGAATTAEDVKRLIYLLLPMGRATVETVAATLGQTVRTLQRELGKRGETYTSVLNAVRREQAIRYLTDHRFTLAHVATQLGYTSNGSFTRWFIAEFGMPPSEWRQHQDSNTTSPALLQGAGMSARRVELE